MTREAAPVRALLLDYYGVMTLSPMTSLSAIADQSGLPPDVVLNSALTVRAGLGMGWWEAAYRGRLTAEEAFGHVIDDLQNAGGNGRVSVASALDAFCSLPLDDRVVAAAQRAAGSGLKVCIVTNGFRPNTGHPGLDRMEREGFGVVNSSDIGHAKPDPEIFRHALNVVGETAENCLFVDDVPDYIEVARSLGMRTHLAADPEHTPHEIMRVVGGV